MEYLVVFGNGPDHIRYVHEMLHETRHVVGDVKAVGRLLLDTFGGLGRSGHHPGIEEHQGPIGGLLEAPFLHPLVDLLAHASTDARLP